MTRALPAVRVLTAALFLLSLGGVGGTSMPSTSTLAVVLLLLQLPALDADRRQRMASALRRHSFIVWLSVIALGGLGFRLLDIGHGLWHVPTDVDEDRLAESVLHFFRSGTIDHSTVEHYPGLHFWLLSGSFLVTYLWNLLTGVAETIGAMPQEPFVWAGRATNAVLEAGTVVLTGLIGRLVARPAVGLLAAGVLAMTPLAVEISTQLRNEAGLLFFLMATVYASLLLTRSGKSHTAIAAGALAGVSAGIKYSVVFGVLSAFAAALFAAPAARAGLAPAARARLLALVAVGFVAAIAVTNHYLWADFPNFINQLSTEVTMTRSRHWSAQASPRWFYVDRLGAAGVGWPLVLFAGATVAVALASRRRDGWILAAFPLPYVWFMTQQEAQFSRWVYPIVPFVAIAGAVGLLAAVEVVERGFRGRGAFRVFVPAMLVGLTVGPVGWGAAVQLSRRLTTPTHTYAEAWLRDHASPEDWILAEQKWLALRGWDLHFERVSNLRAVLAGGYNRLFAHQWIVVPEPYFGDRNLGRLALAQEFKADQGFAGNRGIDFRIYTPRPAAVLRVAEALLGDPDSVELLGPEWRQEGTRDSGLALPPGGARLYVPPAQAGAALRFDVRLETPRQPGAGAPIDVQVDGESIALEVEESRGVDVRLRTAPVPPELLTRRMLVVRLWPVPEAGGLRVTRFSFR